MLYLTTFNFRGYLFYLMADEAALLRMTLVRPSEKCLAEENHILRLAKKQLEEYSAGRRRTFTVPVRQQGTEFQKKVWHALCAIPYGETRTYGQIAAAVGSPKAARAVGGACNKNPIAVIVPCHRVIGASGGLVGFGGGLDLKHRLLELEKQK